jgi:hypothetical protein
MSYGVPSGTTRLEQLVLCGARECSPGAAVHSHNVEVTIEDPTPPSISLGGALASGRWISGANGRPSVEIKAHDSVGIQRVEATIEAASFAESYACNFAVPAPCPGFVGPNASLAIADLTDGPHVLRVAASDPAGNPSATQRQVLVDNTPPDPIVPVVVGGSSWRRSNDFLVRWTDPVTAAAPISRVHWKLCLPGGACGGRGQAPVGEPRELRLATPGAGEYLLHLWLEDAAGNQSEATAAVAVPLRFDPEPPHLAFEPLDAGDPLRVGVSASDRLSGVATGQIEMRPEGTATWHALQTHIENGRLVAYVDDQRFRDGTYLFRAYAVDHAGNEASTRTRADGSTAAIRLPARVDTQLKTGLLRTVTRRKVVRRGGKRRVVRVRTKRLDTRVTARHGRTLRLTGRLTNSDGHPVAGATVDALERLPDGSALPLGFATTGEFGGFRYVVNATRIRDLLFRYSGSRRIGAASATVVVFVPGASSMRASRERALNGQEVTFSGRVGTRPIPAGGKLLELQAYFRGRWRTFSTVRTTPTGGWRFPYRFGATVGRVTYRFRVVLPAENGYPFVTGRSRIVEVVVTGQ